MTSDTPGRRHAPPRAGALVEALRGLGYSTATALADIIDNSITAGAGLVDVSFGWRGDASYIRITDSGRGMTANELDHAMRLGARNPLDARADDLGRFGMGLKTASFSQARRLTVASRSGDGEARPACGGILILSAGEQGADLAGTCSRDRSRVRKSSWPRLMGCRAARSCSGRTSTASSPPASWQAGLPRPNRCVWRRTPGDGVPSDIWRVHGRDLRLTLNGRAVQTVGSFPARPAGHRHVKAPSSHPEELGKGTGWSWLRPTSCRTRTVWTPADLRSCRQPGGLDLAAGVLRLPQPAAPVGRRRLARPQRCAGTHVSGPVTRRAGSRACRIRHLPNTVDADWKIDITARIHSPAAGAPASATSPGMRPRTPAPAHGRCLRTAAAGIRGPNAPPVADGLAS